jgi:hypothetical protein
MLACQFAQYCGGDLEKGWYEFFQPFFDTSVLDLPMLFTGYFGIPNFWVHNPLWYSAIWAGLFTFVFGPGKYARWLKAGIVSGIGIELFYRGITGYELTWLGQAAPFWLIANSILCMVASFSIIGIEKIDRVKGAK